MGFNSGFKGLNFRHVLYVVCFLLGNSPVSELLQIIIDLQDISGDLAASIFNTKKTEGLQCGLPKDNKCGD